MLPKFEKHIRPNTFKMPRKYKLKEERERGGYLRRVLRSARKRERPERWPDERERGERRMGLLKKNEEEKRRRRKEKEAETGSAQSKRHRFT